MIWNVLVFSVALSLSLGCSGFSDGLGNGDGSSLASITLAEPKGEDGVKIVDDWTIGIWADRKAIKHGDEMKNSIEGWKFSNGSVSLTLKKNETFRFEIKTKIEKDGELVDISSTLCQGEKFSAKITQDNQKIAIDVCDKEQNKVDTVGSWVDISINPEITLSDEGESDLPDKAFSFKGYTYMPDEETEDSCNVKINQNESLVVIKAMLAADQVGYTCVARFSVRGYRPSNQRPVMEVGDFGSGHYRHSISTKTKEITSEYDSYYVREVWLGGELWLDNQEVPAISDSCEFDVVLMISLRRTSEGGQYSNFKLPDLVPCS